jgi:hypothetical protein
MNDTQFDNFFNDKLRDFAVPVPASLWDKVVEAQLDRYFGEQLREHVAPVPDGLWDKITDQQFDHFVADKVEDAVSPIPAGLWDKITDKQFDSFVSGKLDETEVPVPANLWDKISDQQFDSFIAGQLGNTEATVPTGLWDKINDKQFDGFVASKFDNTEAPVPANLWDQINDQQFDHFVAGKLADHEAPVPEGLWKKIMPEEEDDRVVFWWFRYPAAAVLILGILLAGAWGGYKYYQSGVKSEELGVKSQQPVSPDNNSTVQSNQTPVTGNQQPATDNSSQSAVGSPQSGVRSEESGVKSEKSETPVDNSTVLNNHAPVTGNRQPVTANSSQSAAGSSQPLSGNSDVSVAGNRAKKFSLRPPVNSADKHLQTDPNDPLRNQLALQKKNDGTEPDDPTSAAESIESYTPNHLQAFIIPTDAGQTTGTHALQQLSTANHTNQFRNIIICPPDRKNRNTDWFLEAYVSPDVSMKSFTNVSATALYVAKKDSNEHAQIGYTAGLRIVKPITDNILVKAGVQYTQINQQYVYRVENEVKTTTVVTQRTIIRAPGDTVIVNDTSTLQTIGFRNNTVKNRYRSFDLPISVGYQFGNDDLKIGINAGVVLNLSSWYQGVLMDSTYAVKTLNSDGNGVYKTNIGLGLIGGISVVKKLGEDMHLFCEPYFRYNLSDMTSPQAKYRQRFSLGGLSVGLRINLNRNN